jgi:protein arginine kinase
MMEQSAASIIPCWFSGAGPDVDVVISTRIRLARNCARYRFPSKASLFERRQVFEEVTAAFKQSPQYNDFNHFNCTQLNKIEQQYLVEERLISAELVDVEGDRGVICDTSRHICIMVNEEDHIRMQAMDSGCCPLDLWNMLDGIDDALGMQLDFAFDNRRGFLTGCPTNSGTGLRVSFLMHLPACILTKNIDQVLLAASQMGVATRGFFGEHSNVVGSFFQLSNAATMGAAETEFLENTKRVVLKTVEAERKARERILADAQQELTDKIQRSYGILTHAIMLDVDEYLNLSSAIRLGIECNLFHETTVPQLNRLTLRILPAHLQTYFKKSMSDDELRIVRAETVKAFFKTGKL